MAPRLTDPRELKREKHKNGSKNIGSQGSREREAQKCLRECRIPWSTRERSTKNGIIVYSGPRHFVNTNNTI